MRSHAWTRREWLTTAGLAPLAAATLGARDRTVADPARADAQAAGTSAAGDRDRARRLRWWREAKFGMFIHWGLYSVLGRHEWVMENEAIPINDYEPLAERFKPKPNAARAWAALAKRAGMKYMVMTTKHHEGFCHFDSKLTDYCAPKRAAGRDLVREYVDAARAEGLRVGFYYSLMDWHHPDGARCEHDEAARRRFVDYIHGQIRELLTNYGTIDVLWYDVAWPLDAKGWESERMNDMVFQLQPDIIVNNRNKLPGDFSTPEQRIQAEQGDRAWESCMTMNGSWGYHAADDAWKRPREIVDNLITCARDGGNYLLNIGPKPDGSIPEASVEILTTVGAWMARNGQAIYGADRCQISRSNYANFTRKGNTLFVHVRYWPGDTVVVGGLRNKVLGAKLAVTGAPVRFDQDEYRARLVGLPAQAPDSPFTTIAVECEGEPKQDTIVVRRQKPRAT
jgi:alpha-L-fucosidase